MSYQPKTKPEDLSWSPWMTPPKSDESIFNISNTTSFPSPYSQRALNGLGGNNVNGLDAIPFVGPTYNYTYPRISTNSAYNTHVEDPFSSYMNDNYILHDKETILPEEIEHQQISTVTPKSAAIDITLPKKKYWGNEHMNIEMSDGRNKNLGKVAINMDTNLSSSTDDLLKLAGGSMRERLKINFPSSPSTDSALMNYHQLDTQDRKSDVRSKNKNLTPEPHLDEIGDYSQLVGGFQSLAVSPLAPMPEDRVNIIPSPRSQPICRYFASGFCSRGERCNFLHVEYGAALSSTVMHKTRFNKSGRVPLPASRYANLTIEECVGDIASMCLDQHGCRYLQRQLDTCDPALITLIFNEVIVHIVELMSDPFGNYLCQKLIEHVTEKQRIEVVKAVASDLVQISKNMHGTRAVQKLIEHVSTSEENKVIRKALKGSVVALIQDLNGNHVIQKCLHKMEPNDNQFIYDAVAQHCIQVSTHRHGCCVMQRCVDHATFNQKLQLVNEIKRSALTLVQDAFGNYVVQYALDLNIPGLATDLIFQLQDHIHHLAKQKFSSNVVEKCLKSGDTACVVRVLRELLGEDPDPNVIPVPTSNPELIQQKLVDLLQDSYGNYVIQTCLSEGASCSPAEYSRMTNLLRPYVHQLRSAPYIKRIHNLLNLPTTYKTNKETERLNLFPSQEFHPNYRC